MAAGNEIDANENDSSSVSESRQRLRPWLIHKLNTQQIQGLHWIKQDEMIFRIPWKHGGKQDWVEEHAQIFMEWARHTGKYREGVDQPTYARWKTNLRCALNKAPDIQELVEQSRKDEPNPFKVYKFLERKKKVLPHLKDPNKSVTAPQVGSHSVPVFIQEYSSGGSGSFEAQPHPTGMGAEGATGVDGERLPSDLKSLKSGELMPIGPNVLSMSEAIPSQEGMEFEETQVQEGPTSPYSQFSQPSPAESYTLQQQSPQHQPTGNSDLTPPAFPVPCVNINPVTQPFTPLGYSVAKTERDSPPTDSVQVGAMLPMAASYLGPMSHSCVTKNGCEMNVEVIYRSHTMLNYHVDHSKGCRVSYGSLAPERENEIPEVLKAVLYGDAAHAMIELPEWRAGLCSAELIPSVNDLLNNMQRGLILECDQGNIEAIRLCKTSIYFSSIVGNESKKLVRDDKLIQKTPIFKMDEFTKALEEYQANNDVARPSADIYLFIGQKGSTHDLNQMLIVVKVTSCIAAQRLREVDDDRIGSIHISDTTDMDAINDCVRGQLQDPGALATHLKLEPDDNVPVTQYATLQSVPVVAEYLHTQDVNVPVMTTSQYGEMLQCNAVYSPSGQFATQPVTASDNSGFPLIHHHGQHENIATTTATVTMPFGQVVDMRTTNYGQTQSDNGHMYGSHEQFLDGQIHSADDINVGQYEESCMSVQD